MPVFVCDGNKINYCVRGPDDAPSILIMHGLAADSRQSLEMFAAVRGFRLIAPDLPGHGESPLDADAPIAGQVGFQRYAHLMTCLLDHLGAKEVLAGGTSMGAGIAIALCRLVPRVVRGLFLVRPAWLAGPAVPHLDLVAEAGRLIGQNGLDSARDELFASPAYGRTFQGNEAAGNSLLGAFGRPQAEAAAAVLPLLVEDRPLERLADAGECKCPALVLGTNADPLHPPAIARTLAAALGSGKYVHLPPRYLEPQAFQAALTANFERFLPRCGFTADTRIGVGDKS